MGRIVLVHGDAPEGSLGLSIEIIKEIGCHIMGTALNIRKISLFVRLSFLFFLAIQSKGWAQINESKFELGFEQQIRNYHWNNIQDFNDAAPDQRLDVRYRTRVWGGVALGKNVDLFAGLIQESKQILDPKTPMHFDEIAFESLYLDFKKLPLNGLTLRVGRQNISRGEGFVLHKGTGSDGSRTMYFNAFNLAYTRKKSKLEIMGMLQPYKDRLLPVIHDQSRVLVEWDEQALGAYYTDNTFKNTNYEAYYFFKKEFRDRRPSSDYQFQPDRHIHTLGGRLTQRFSGDWEADGEMAVQWGSERPVTPVRGIAGYGYLKKTWYQKGVPNLSFGYFGLSGDNPGTSGRVEGWDPVFSRWSKWNKTELYVLSVQREKGLAYWTNLKMWRTEFNCTPLKSLSARLVYYRVGSFHPFGFNPAIFGTGTFRGNLYEARAEVNAGKYWKGLVIFERFAPGNFYASRTAGNLLYLGLYFQATGKYGT